ncbi:hypothetical protein [Chromobacterium amazonense]|uniref:hypothetical protein n=1 Tax=Chromobacterium amazonense TaxID=1382803 RepID=UPI003F7993CD
MIRLLVIQQLFNLSDAQLEFSENDLEHEEGFDVGIEITYLLAGEAFDVFDLIHEGCPHIAARKVEADASAVDEGTVIGSPVGDLVG